MDKQYLYDYAQELSDEKRFKKALKEKADKTFQNLRPYIEKMVFDKIFYKN